MATKPADEITDELRQCCRSSFSIYKGHHIRNRKHEKYLLGTTGQFCAAFYHVHEWNTRPFQCLDETTCKIGQEATLGNDLRKQPKTVVAVVNKMCKRKW